MMTADCAAGPLRPDWLPEAARLYIEHTEAGQSLRNLARRRGCHPSTVLRIVRKFESRRDDPLLDEALEALGRARRAGPPPSDGKDSPDMTAPLRHSAPPGAGDDAHLAREARRILRRLAEPGAILAVAPDMEKAVVLRSFPDGRQARTGILDRGVAQAFALKDWIACSRPGRVASYVITGPGRAALKRLLEEDERARQGLADAAAAFGAQHRDWEERAFEADEGPSRRLRVNAAESPVTVLARRREKDGSPFLGPELVAAAERLREDFELAQMGPRTAQNWERFLTGTDRGGFGPSGPGEGPRAARERVAAALRDLGPGLGDMALRVCCFLEGLETAERRMGWSARSGKIVLRIALSRLRRHYDEVGGGLIG